MNFFEMTLLNIILIFFPLLLYLIYVAYSSNIDKKENNIFLELALFSSLYLIFRFGRNIGTEIPNVLIMNVPLMIAYIKKRHIGILFISTFLILYTHHYYQFYWIVLVLEYFIYFLLFMIKEKKQWSYQRFIHLFLVVNSCSFLYFLLQHSVSTMKLFEMISMIVSMIIVTYLSLLLFQKGEEILKLHMTIKELEKEKQIRMSLFQITHEIKNPIAVCKGYLDMFDINNQEHSRKYVPIIKEEIARTLILLQDFLSLQKIKIEKDILDIGLLLEEIMTSFEPLFKSKVIEVNVKIPNDEIYMNGDYNRLKQVFINLLKNSVEAMTNQRKHKLSLKVTDMKDQIEVKITDNGVGITEENIKKMKNPFFSTKSNGTGLGVYLSNEIVKAHSGKIDFLSDKQGTTVILVFPKGMDNELN